MKTIWNRENIKSRALEFKTKGEFQKAYPGAYNAARRLGILKDVCSYMEVIREFRTDEELHQIARKYKSKKEFYKNDPAAYSAASRRRVLSKICDHMESELHYRTDEELQKIAEKYKTRGEFYKNDPAAHLVAYRRNILDKICVHMEEVHHHYSDDEEIHAVALKYDTRTEFAIGDASAYVLARVRGILNHVCDHMPKVSTVSAPERELGDELRIPYPSTKTLKIRKRGGNLIPGHPWIKGFDIDHYISELLKGIEFDGIFWHSIKGLKSSPSRKDWPLEDLQNYHDIKDAYFATLGIEILHIKEADWIKDKDACIKRCLDFLAATPTPPAP
jgi:hypothetical protein